MEVHQIERVLKAFEKFDKDGDGVLDAGESSIIWPSRLAYVRVLTHQPVSLVRAEEFYQLKEELMPEVSKVLLRLHTEKRYGPAHIECSYD